jgi:hypothetical protein
MNKQDDPNLIWYTGPLSFEDDPEMIRRAALAGQPLHVVPAAAQFSGVGYLGCDATPVEAAGAPFAAVGGLSAEAVQMVGPRQSAGVGRRRLPQTPRGAGPTEKPVKSAARRDARAIPGRLAAPVADAAGRTAQGPAAELVRLYELLGPPALLTSEDPRAFDRLYAEVRRALLPRSFIEEMEVRDIVETAWQMRRLVAARSGVLDGAFEDAVADVLHDIVSPRWIEINGKRRRAGDSQAQQALRQRLLQAGLTEATLHGRALADYGETLERFEDLIDRLLARRDRLLREMERRRAGQDRPAQSRPPPLVEATQPGGAVPGPADDPDPAV